MRIRIELYYETRWIARGEGLYLTAPSLLELRERLVALLHERSLSPPYEVAVSVDPERVPGWMLGHLDPGREIVWKL